MSIDIADSSGSDLADPEALRRQTVFLLEALLLDPQTEVSIALVGAEEMERLHVQWMDEPGPTDVLSFPMDGLTPGVPGQQRPSGVLGDIVLCPVVAQRQAEVAGHSVTTELELLLTHGVLHLLGYDHAEPEEHAMMFARQDELLRRWHEAG